MSTDLASLRDTRVTKSISAVRDLYQDHLVHTPLVARRVVMAHPRVGESLSFIDVGYERILVHGAHLKPVVLYTHASWRELPFTEAVKALGGDSLRDFWMRSIDSDLVPCLDLLAAQLKHLSLSRHTRSDRRERFGDAATALANEADPVAVLHDLERDRYIGALPDELGLTYAPSLIHAYVATTTAAGLIAGMETTA
jgi:hypothetical protein